MTRSAHRLALVTVSAVWFAATTTTLISPALPVAAAGLDGQAIFLAQKCNLCHAVSSVGITATSKSEKTAGPDLSTLTKAQERPFLKEFLVKKADLNGKKHLKEYKGSAEELDALILWLEQQLKK